MKKSASGLVLTGVIASLLSGCSSGNNDGLSSVANMSNDKIQNLFKASQGIAVAPSDDVGQAASNQTTLLVLILVVAIGILVAVLANKSKK